MTGILYGVGVGPGDPTLLTMKAVKVITDCDVIGIPSTNIDVCTAWRIAVEAIPEISQKEIITVPVPMTKQLEELEEAYTTGCKKLVSALDIGKSISFLNLGDPTLYGSYMEIHKRIRMIGYQTEIVSGVPSICAVAAALNEPLGERNESIHIFPSNYDLKSLTKFKGTKILMKPASKLKSVKQQLINMERNGRYKASAVTNCGMPKQKIYQRIENLDENSGYFVTIMVKEQS